MQILPKHLLSCLLVVVATPGCISETKQFENFGEAKAHQSWPTEAWRVVEAGHVRGYAVRFDDPIDPQLGLISVRNALNQDMGWIDSQGRAWRFVLHGEAEWLGTGSVLHGTSAILGLAQDALLESIGIDQLPRGSARQGR
ncbi:MAG: hypothetical protein R3F17_12975 [Planctomycetota bacterium]